MSEKLYTVNEMFYSLQGEGMRAGTANVFVRFSGCNMRCRKEEADDSPGGFDCDTEFASGRRMSLEDIHEQAEDLAGECRWQVLTGGEPGLQVDREYCEFMRARKWKLAIETNGSILLPHYEADRPEDGRITFLLDWITVSPKVAEHAVRQKVASEVKYVRGYGQGIPQPACKAKNKLLSPAYDGLQVDRAALAWCAQLVRENPEWRLSVQAHKEWGLR